MKIEYQKLSSKCDALTRNLTAVNAHVSSYIFSFFFLNTNMLTVELDVALSVRIALSLEIKNQQTVTNHFTSLKRVAALINDHN